MVTSQTVGLTEAGRGGRELGGSGGLEITARREVESGSTVGLNVIAAPNLERMSLPNKGRGHWGITRNL